MSTLHEAREAEKRGRFHRVLGLQGKDALGHISHLLLAIELALRKQREKDEVPGHLDAPHGRLRAGPFLISQLFTSFYALFTHHVATSGIVQQRDWVEPEVGVADEKALALE